MKIKLTLAMVFLFLAIAIQSQSNDDVKLIDPIFETDPMTESKAKNLIWLQTFRNWGVQKLGLDTIMQDYTGKGIKVCICDTGEPTHSSLKQSIAGSENFTFDPDVIDGNGHSTHVAGIIHEIVPNAQLYFAKVLSNNGSGSSNGVSNGIIWCKDQGANIINLSLGSRSPSPAMKQAIDRVIADSVLVIAAAGNSGQSQTEDRIGYPAKYDNVISIGSINRNLNVSSFSSSGENGDVVAPGEAILSTWLDDQFRVLSGTSMASPYAAGMTAIMLEVDFVRKGVEGRYEDSAVDILKEGYDVISFHGLIDKSVYGIESPDPGPEPEPEDPFGNSTFLIVVLVGLLGFVFYRIIVK